MQQLVARLLGREDVDSIDSMDVSFGAEWAHDGPAWVLFGCLALSVLAIGFYVKYQQRAHKGRRIWLGILRAALLCFLLLILADPILEVAFTSHPKPVLWVLLDGTDSMNIEDHVNEADQERLKDVVDWDGLKNKAVNSSKSASSDDDSADDEDTAKPKKPDEDIKLERVSRADLVRAWIERNEGEVLSGLNKDFRVQVFQFAQGDDVEALELSKEGEKEFDAKYLMSQYKPDAPVTSLGGSFDDLRRRHSSSYLAGMLVVSDFDHNSGAGPLQAARKSNVPIFTMGVGATHAVDLSVDLQTSLKMKKAESTTVTALLRQQELTGTEVTVHVYAQPILPGEDQALAKKIEIGERSVTLDRPSMILEFPFTPEESGRFVFVAEVEPAEGEIVEQNNRAERDVTVIDDFMRLLFVEYEPTWEWRFVKEVFHRDKLVGMRGFRTYLRSSDPIVRENNELFLPTVTLPRNEFFEYDVIFLGDMPSSTLSSRFCEMTKEFVGKFGGGLVVMAGPRFGPGELAGTAIADMLPVVVDPDGQMLDSREFDLQLTPLAPQYDFMRLGETDQEMAKGWGNLGRLPWYQPVRRIETSASTVLAEHPTDTCIDGKTPQPLIAIRKYGRGEVIYIAHNEMWRLRRKYGELYYRQFWGQLIHRLGLSHALGLQKRFVVRTDRQQYQPDDSVLLTVEAYDENFEPLAGEDLDERHLEGELWLPDRGTDALGETRSINLTEYRPGVFETRIPVSEAGDYVARVIDPISQEPVDVYFQVNNLSIERRSATRNRSLQDNIAAETQGRSFEMHEAKEILAGFKPERLTETSVEVFPLWSTWLCFTVVIVFMMTEWFIRKLSNLV
jgi:hypothetical protein